MKLSKLKWSKVNKVNWTKVKHSNSNSTDCGTATCQMVLKNNYLIEFFTWILAFGCDLCSQK